MRSIAIHSHKGGVGKTTIAINLAVLLASRGKNVCLMDFDLGGPNLYTFFPDLRPSKYLDDYFQNKATRDEFILEVSDQMGLSGNLYLGLTNPSSEHVTYMTTMGTEDLMKMLQSAFKLRRELKEEYNIDYFILDTTPGLAYTTINSFMLSDLILFVVKFSNSDIEGTINMITGILDNLPNDAAIMANSIPPSKLDNTGLIDELQSEIEHRIHSETGLGDIRFLGWVPYDPDMLEYEFDNMVKQMRNEQSRRLIHALMDQDNIVRSAFDSIVRILIEG